MSLREPRAKSSNLRSTRRLRTSRSHGSARSTAFSWANDSPFLLPAVILIAGLFLLPNLVVMVSSFTSWNSYVEEIRWVGWSNFDELLSSGAFLGVLSATLLYGIAAMFIQNGLALSLALALEAPNKMNTVLRTIFFIPLLISPVAAGFIFRAVLAPNGSLNGAISFISGTTFEFSWFGEVSVTVFVVAFIHAWKYLGLSLLIYLAGLAAIPSDQIEAARVDGAGWLRSLWAIKLPMMGPALTFNVVIGMVAAFNTADIVLSTTNGGPGGTTELAQVFVIKQFGQGYFGTASAMSLAALVMIAVIAIPLITYLRHKEVEA